MIKFFRKIRQKLVHENRVGKYLLYAVGEIILVIIGILIAINLNKISEAKIQEKKIVGILRQVQDELNATIDESNDLIEFYREKDSLIHLVMNRELTKEDYENPENLALRNLITSGPLVLQNDGFNNLMTESEALSSTYTPLIKELKQFYINTAELIEYGNNSIDDIVATILKYRMTNYDWYPEFIYSRANLNGGTINDEALNYYLNDNNYRTHLVDISQYSRFSMGTGIIARINAIKLIREIDSLLGTHNTYGFDIDINDYTDWIGNYHYEGDTMQIAQDEGSLKRIYSGGEHPIYPLSLTKFHYLTPLFMVFEKDEQGEIDGYTVSQGSFRRYWEKIK